MERHVSFSLTRRLSSLLLEGMHSVAPVEDVEDLVVDAHRDGEAHDGEGDCGDHSDDAELEQGQQANH